MASRLSACRDPSACAGSPGTWRGRAHSGQEFRSQAGLHELAGHVPTEAPTSPRPLPPPWPGVALDELRSLQL